MSELYNCICGFQSRGVDRYCPRCGRRTATSYRRCPHDGAKCHHGCKPDDDCFRKVNEMELSTPYDGYSK